MSNLLLSAEYLYSHTAGCSPLLLAAMKHVHLITLAKPYHQSLSCT